MRECRLRNIQQIRYRWKLLYVVVVIDILPIMYRILRGCSMIYDVVILGGGIAGLYSAYQLLRRSPHTKILIIEKNAYLGGRVYTYTGSDMPIPLETGAARFSDNHTRVRRLIRELGLDDKVVSNPVESRYVADGKVAPDYHADLAEVATASQKEPREYLQSVSFFTYAKRVIGIRRAQHIVDSFGYYSELVVMNAHDAIQLMGVLDTSQHRFHSLSGGLEQVIERLGSHIRRHRNARIWTKRKVVDVSEERAHSGGRSRGLRHTTLRRTVRTVRSGRDRLRTYRIEVEDRAGRRFSVYAKKCIFALPKQALEPLAIMRPVRPLLRQIACGSLCRIYARFPKSDMDWLKGLVKTMTNNDLRMIIPIDAEEGVVMISYTDNRFADKWRDLEKMKGLDAVKDKLMRLIRETFPRSISEPMSLKLFYWPCGVGYWKVGADSAALSRRMVRPFPNKDIYVCGEHFSEKNQQWMEGALETSESVLSII